MASRGNEFIETEEEPYRTVMRDSAIYDAKLDTQIIKIKVN